MICERLLAGNVCDKLRTEQNGAHGGSLRPAMDYNSLMIIINRVIVDIFDNVAYFRDRAKNEIIQSRTGITTVIEVQRVSIQMAIDGTRNDTPGRLWIQRVTKWRTEPGSKRRLVH